MSTEALSLDSAVEKLMGGNESVQDETVEDVDTETTDDSEDEYELETEEDDSDVDAESEHDDADTDEESADVDSEPEHAEPKTLKVKVDGQEVEVTLEDLKRSYSGQGKIQKGMQEAAQARKQAEEILQQAQAYAQQTAQMYEQAHRQGFKAPPKEPSRELFDRDPIGYMDAKIKYDDDLKAYNAERQNMMAVYQQQAQQSQIEQQKMLQREMQMLQERIPELADASKAGKFKEDLVSVGSQYGYTQDELSGVMDHRAILVLRDAMKWRQSQAKRSQVEGKTQKARPVIKPQAKKSLDPKGKQARAAKSKLKNTGSIDDALSLIMSS